MSSILNIEIHVPSLICDFCGRSVYPEGLGLVTKEPPLTLSIHRLAEIVSLSDKSAFQITGFTQADLESQALGAGGWKRFQIYGKDLIVCPICQQKGTAPGFDDRLKRMALLLGMRAILKAPTLEQAKETAEIAIREGGI